jgi:hypothetical protein
MANAIEPALAHLLGDKPRHPDPPSILSTQP